MLWRASAGSIRGGVCSAMRIVHENNFASVAFPVLGAGSGGFDEERALQIMQREFEAIGSEAQAVIVEYAP